MTAGDQGNVPRTRAEMWAENDAAWAAIFKCWVVWLVLGFGGGALCAVSAPLGFTLIGLGFLAVLYGLYVVARYGCRQARFLRSQR